MHIFEFVVSTNTFHLMLRLDLIPPYQVYHFDFFVLILRSSPKQLYNAGTKSMFVCLFVFFFPNVFVDKALLTVERNCAS